MRGKNDILADIRRNKPGFAAPAPHVPYYDDDYPRDTDGLVERFVTTLEKMGGVWCAPTADETLEDTMRRVFAQREIEATALVSNVPEITGNRRLRAGDAARPLHDVDVAVLRARFGVAETGSVCFTERELIVNAIGYLAQHLIVLLDPRTIVTNLHRAYQRDDYQNARYTVFHTGPSATADIEGVLVRGAQGVRSLTIIPAHGSA
ncbi:LUD domain-containing protein [Salinisphaera sp. Q1T1-3]|uniref:LutC/YkgG family protein n=1 Tax=Salinisphaera sp. Q1T1-3 TaxID=2321229 RepID=UPI000E7570F9|nr:LUD domain-containing protein [Salinisphaera sp. Q1T1-3]RJS91069.1 hypothetical protein D3260_16535 [Salinisphaera sp. Q1T1-3]